MGAPTDSLLAAAPAGGMAADHASRADYAHLRQLVHPNDLGELDRLCSPAADPPVGASVRREVRLPGTGGSWVAGELDARRHLRDEITTQLMVAMRMRRRRPRRLGKHLPRQPVARSSEGPVRHDDRRQFIGA